MLCLLLSPTSRPSETAGKYNIEFDLACLISPDNQMIYFNLFFIDFFFFGVIAIYYIDA
jgi:hypothetical protein